MELNGWIRECTLIANIALDADAKVYESKEAETSKGSQQNLYKFLLKACKQDDVLVLLETEKVLLNLDLQNRANSPEEISSITNAISQIKTAIEAYDLVLDGSLYTSVTKSYADKQKKNGLPQDAVCIFIQSHTARLNNKLAAPLSVPVKNVLRQRKENIGKVKELYTDLQRVALGISVPDKKNELSR